MATQEQWGAIKAVLKPVPILRNVGVSGVK